MTISAWRADNNHEVPKIEENHPSPRRDRDWFAIFFSESARNPSRAQNSAAHTRIHEHKWTDSFMGAYQWKAAAEAEVFVARASRGFGTLPLALHLGRVLPRGFPAPPARFTPRLHYTIPNKLGYCILRCRAGPKAKALKAYERARL